MKVDDFGKLHEAEEKLLNHIKEGSYKFLNLDYYQSSTPKIVINYIRADFLRAIILNRFEDVNDANERLYIEGAHIYEALSLSGTEINREICFRRCTFTDGLFANRSSSKSIQIYQSKIFVGLNANGLQANGSVYLNGNDFYGEVSLIGAKINGTLECNKSNFLSRKKSLDADLLEVTGDISLINFNALGEVILVDAKVGGVLYVKKSKFGQFSSDRMQASSDVFMDDVEANGEIRFIGASIGGNLSFHGSTLQAEDKSLNCAGVKIRGGWLWRLGAKSKGCIDLTAAEIGHISDEASCWPPEIILDRCTYSGFVGNKTPTDAVSRIDWLSRLNPNKNFHDFWPQPYEECARVLHASGKIEDARQVLIKKEYLLSKVERKKLLDKNFYGQNFRKKINCIPKLLSLTIIQSLRKVISYGHRPMKAIYILIFIAALGAIVFSQAYSKDGMRPNQPDVLFSQEWINCDPAAQGASGNYFKTIQSQVDCYLSLPVGKSYPKFNPISYSVNAVVPIMSSEGQSNWIPNDRTIVGKCTIIYLWIHTIVGWALMILAVAGFSGIVKTNASR